MLGNAYFLNSAQHLETSRCNSEIYYVAAGPFLDPEIQGVIFSYSLSNRINSSVYITVTQPDICNYPLIGKNKCNNQIQRFRYIL